MVAKMQKPDEEWKKELAPEQYHVMREKGTEQAFTGVYWDCHDEGTYRCAACGQAVFSSGTKYDSGTGWPSFMKPMDDQAVETAKDTSHGMVREEVVCSNCGAHLGHLFDDGPGPEGHRYCINSAALKLEKSK